MFIDDITNWLPDRLIKYNNVVLIGDMNIHLNDHTSDDNAGIFMDTLAAMGFTIHMADPNHHSGHTIDLIATQSGSTLAMISCTCGPYLLDHCVLNCTTSVVHKEAIRKSITYRKAGSININKFITDCDLSNISLSDVDDMVNAFNTQLKNPLDNNVPEITKQMTVRKKVPWFTQEIREKKRIVHRRETIWKKYRREDQWQALKIERSSYRQMLKKANAESITMMIEDCNRDSKKLYNLASLLMGMVKENPLADHMDKEELADQFSSFFITKIQKIRDQLDSLPTYCHTSSDPPEFLEFESMLEEGVESIIRSMPAKMCNMDIIPTILLKDALSGLLPTITKIVNASMTQGVFLSSWKIALVKPLLKKLGLELIESNYRLVSNLPFLSKVVEKCVLRRFNKHCKRYDPMPDYQSAYQANYSCEMALLKIMDDILCSMEKQEVVPLITINLSAAFDTVDHELLLAVLRKKFGIDQVTLKWFGSYLGP